LGRASRAPDLKRVQVWSANPVDLEDLKFIAWGIW
jgi:hypothetical protein